MLRASQMLGDLWLTAWQQAPPDMFLRSALAKRKAAQEHFRAAMKTGAILYGNYDICWMILGRMEQDPSWPRTIPSSSRTTPARPS